MRLTAGFTAMMAGAFLAGSAGAQQIAASVWGPPAYPFTESGYTEWARAVDTATNGEVKIEVFAAGALLAPIATTQGVADGLAQVGFVAAGYDPSHFPVSNALDALGYKYPDPLVLMFAFSDFMMNEKEGLDEWRANRVVFGGAYETPNYQLTCRENYETLADLQGKRVRTAGGGWSRFTDSIGMVPVNLPGTDLYPAMERGAVDCANSEASTLKSFKLAEVAKRVILINMSPNYTGATWAYNPDFWKGLSPEHRRVLFNESARAMVRMDLNFTRQVGEALDEARAAGVTIAEADPTLRAAYDKWVSDGVGGALELARTNHGIAEPQELFDRFEAYILKWQDLFAQADRTDEEALTKIARENLFDKIDVVTYGIE